VVSPARIVVAMMLQIAGASSMLAGRIRMTFIVPHKLKCPQRRQRGHDLLATTAIAAQGICWIARLSVLMWVKVPSAFNGETSYKPTYGSRGRRSVLPHNFRVARHTTRIALSFQGMRFISATANLSFR